MPNFTTEILWLTLIPGTVSGIPPIVPVSVPPPHDTLIGVRIGREHHFRAADPGEPALRRGGHRFASHRIRRGKHARFRDRRMLLQQTVDLGGLHVEAGTVDLVLDPAGEPNAPGTIDSAAIAGAVPAVL